MSSPTNHRDPANRRLSFHAPSTGTSSAQERRREAALRAQSQHRQHAFLAARQLSSGSALLEMDDLTLSGGEESTDSESERDQFADAPASPTSPKSPRLASSPTRERRTSMSKAKKPVRVRRPKYKPWAANLLSHAETLRMGEGLPERFETEWSLSVVPKGKRCLCVTGNSGMASNSVLLSRVAGRTLARRGTILPPDCLLDCVYDKAKGVLWVLDLVKWAGQWFVECEADFRFFFLAARLAELAPQPFLPAPSPASPLLVLPAPHQPAPLPFGDLIKFLPSLGSTSTVPASLLSPPNAAGERPSVVQVQIPMEPTGALLYLNSAHYESGTTALVGWVPLRPEEGEESREGVGRLLELSEARLNRGHEVRMFDSQQA